MDSPSPVDTSPTGPSMAPAPASWRTVGGAREASPSGAGRRPTDTLLFEVTDASVVRGSASKYVVSWSSQESTPSRADRPAGRRLIFNICWQFETWERDSEPLKHDDGCLEKEKQSPTALGGFLPRFQIYNL